MKRFRILLVALALASAVAPPAPATQSGRRVGNEVLTNASVESMTRAGLSTEVIVAKIRASTPRFDVSTDELIRLKQAGIANEVINAMIDAMAAENSGERVTLGRSRRVETTEVASTLGFPPPTESGIYYAPEPAETGQLVLIEPNVYIQSKETGAWKTAVSQGILKTHSKAILPGPRARMQIDERRPTFYFFFDVPNAGLSSAGTVWGPATSANEFVLARLDVRKSTRELGVGERGNYTGVRTGVDGNRIQLFDAEKLAPGVYRVRPKEDLEDGEYCFFFAGAVAASGGGGGPKLFDFGVGASKKESVDTSQFVAETDR